MRPERGIAGLFLLFGVVFLFAAPAEAVIFGFDGLIPGNGVPSYDEEGYRVSTTGQLFASGSAGNPPPSMFPSSSGNNHTMVRLDGAPFDIFSLEFGEINSTIGSQTVTFTGHLWAGGTVNQTFVSDGPYGLELFNFNPTFRAMASLTWGADPWIMDNLVVDLDPTYCNQSMALVANQWELISVPCSPGNTVSNLLGDDGLGVYGVNWAVVERDEFTGWYRQMLAGDPMVQGMGYWIKVLSGTPTIDLDGLFTSIAIPFEIPLVTGAAPGVWNLLGHPFEFLVPWSDVAVYDTVSMIEYPMWDANSGLYIANRTMYSWNGSSYQSIHPVSNPGPINLFDGFWVQVLDLPANLRIPPALKSPEGGQPPLGPGEWFVQLIVESEPYRDPGNRLGRLQVATDGPDEYDLRELTPHASPYLTVVLPHPEWGTDVWSYTTDFRHAGYAGGDSWSFEILSDQGRTVTLSWLWGGDVGDVVKRSAVIDVESGAVIDPNQTGAVTLAMAGPRHRLQWRVNTVPEVDAGPAVEAAVGEPVKLVASFADSDPDDHHSATISWGDGTSTAGVVDGPFGGIRGAHVYPIPGIYQVTVCVSDAWRGEGCDTTTATAWPNPSWIFGDGFETGDSSAW